MILDKIIAHKRKELAAEQTQVPLTTLEAEVVNLPPARNFQGAITGCETVKLIAEVKKKSPSKGIIREDFHPVSIAETYVENGAAAISVLTDKHFFAGELDYLRAIRENVDVPLLRKDFTIDPYHIYQARCAGADAILLIVAALTAAELRIVGVSGGGTYTRRIGNRVGCGRTNYRDKQPGFAYISHRHCHNVPFARDHSSGQDCGE